MGRDDDRKHYFMQHGAFMQQLATAEVHDLERAVKVEQLLGHHCRASFRHPAHLGRLPAGLWDTGMRQLMREMMPLLLAVPIQPGIFAESITRLRNVLLQPWSMHKTYATSPHALQPVSQDVLPYLSVFKRV